MILYPIQHFSLPPFDSGAVGHIVAIFIMLSFLHLGGHHRLLVIQTLRGINTQICWPTESTLEASRVDSAKERRSCKEDLYSLTEALTYFPKHKNKTLNGNDNLVSD